MDALSQFLNSLLATGDTGSLLLATFAAFLGGLLSSLTPCVYPMIPITVGVIGGLSTARESHSPHPFRPILLRAFFYIGGMTLVYSALGILAGLTGKIFGSLTNTVSWYLGLGCFITIAALILLDVIPFDPYAWWNRIRPKKHPVHSATTHSEMTLLGAFALGASSGLIASPCTTPVLTVILAFIAKTESVWLGLLLMVSFSLGLSLLLLAVAAFTGALQILPRSGPWLKTMKIMSGLVLLAFAEYLIYRAGKLGGL